MPKKDKEGAGKGDYEVGYGKPPKRTRFQKGRSGNRKGRPKGRKNVSTIMNEVMDRTVTITENRQKRRVKYTEALVNQMAAKALNGSMREQTAMLKVINEYAPKLLKEPEPDNNITVQYVLPNGKTAEDYDEDYPSSNPLAKGPEDSSV